MNNTKELTGFRRYCAEQNISFTAQPGQFVAIVGGTGTGKSSLVNLIPRFYDVHRGKVLVERSLSELQENLVKMQVVFQTKELPQLPEDMEVLNVQQVGRIHTLIVRGRSDEVTNRLAVYSPILMDALPLTLEEIFIYELGGEGYEVRDAVL